MHLHRLRFSRSSVCQSPLLRLVGGCRLGLRAARPAPTGSATASRQAGTHHDSAFQLQYSYYRLRWSLRPSCSSGATVHVVSAPASIVLARQKRIDAAFVGFGADAETVRLCEHLKGLGVSQIVVAPSDAGADHAVHRGIVSRLSPAPRSPGSNGAIVRVLTPPVPQSQIDGRNGHRCPVCAPRKRVLDPGSTFPPVARMAVSLSPPHPRR
jgi:hypothetical protein